MIVMGIDPGSKYTGIGIVRKHGSRIIYKHHHLVDLYKVKGHTAKCAIIHHRIKELINEYQPDLIAIETPFHSKFVKTTIVLGMMRGAIFSGIGSTIVKGKRPEIVDLSPAQIKKTVTRTGRAKKWLVENFVKLLLGSEHFDESTRDDIYDALAIAIAGAQSEIK